MILLDTHVWIWWLTRSGRLTEEERETLSQAAEHGGLSISAISLWEAHLLNSRQRIALPSPFPAWLIEATDPRIVGTIPIDTEVVLALDELPKGFHGDPADRLIAATSRCKGLPLATWDKALRRSRSIEIWRP